MQKGLRMVIVGLMFIAAVTGIVCAGTVGVGTTSADGVVPTLVTGEPGGQQTWCSYSGCTGTQFKIEGSTPSESPYYVDSTHWIRITASSIGGQTGNNAISWSSNFPVNCILVKGANGADSYNYCYDPSNREDARLSSPIAGSSGKPAVISGIYLCYEPPTTDVPEFPAWFISLAGVALLAAVLVSLHRK